jgi:hypothetical protein
VHYIWEKIDTPAGEIGELWTKRGSLSNGLLNPFGLRLPGMVSMGLESLLCEAAVPADFSLALHALLSNIRAVEVGFFGLINLVFC